MRISDWSSDVCSSDLPSGELQINAGYSSVGSQHFFASRAADAQPDAIKEQYAAENRLGRIPGYGLDNGRIAYKIDNPNMEFAIFGRNLANKKYLTRSFADLYRSLGIATEFSGCVRQVLQIGGHGAGDRKSTRLNSSH